MKITEIKWENGKQYRVGDLVCTVKAEDVFVCDAIEGREKLITDYMTLVELLEADFTEFVDWSKVEVDTKIRVRNDEDCNWQNRYFSKYENGKVYAWKSGITSWSADDEHEVTRWKYAELAE